GGRGSKKGPVPLPPLWSRLVPSPSGLIITHKFDPISRGDRINTMRCTIELRHVRLGDKRLNHRFLKLVDDLTRQPEPTSPKTSGKWPATKAASRFFDNPSVRHQDIRDALRRDALGYLPDH